MPTDSAYQTGKSSSSLKAHRLAVEYCKETSIPEGAELAAGVVSMFLGLNAAETTAHETYSSLHVIVSSARVKKGHRPGQNWGRPGVDPDS
ncbi:hypothetical protein PG985_006140 [Apiospora marii]|uniref:Uncharacterized protein n=1 Tax=Apiospora marii TaxID=335849 RepID=A0ABR1S6Z8_9PEZI